MSRAVLSLAVGVGLCVAVTAAAPRTPRAATRAADVWLQLVDHGRYGDSWQTASALFKHAVTKEGWENALEQVRAPLGPIVRRRRIRVTAATSLPGVPPGHYVVVEYRTSFAHKPSAAETVTCAQEADGAWRVAGYFIR